MLLPQRHAGSLKNFRYRAASHSIDDEAFLVKAVFAKEQLGQSVAIHIDCVDQLQPWRYVQTRRISDAGGKLLRHALKVDARDHGDVARDKFSRSAFTAGRQIAAPNFRA